MIPWEKLARAPVPGGGELVLRRRGRDWVITVDGKELMSNTVCASEEEMARLAAARLAPRPDPRVLIGGLGMGFTARAALDALPAAAEVVVAEIAPAIVEWNRGLLADLARRPLDDPRLTVEIDDVARVIARSPARFDAILLDVDNGPQGLVRKANGSLYTDEGLAAARRALRPRGLIVVWSAAPDIEFEKRLRRSGHLIDIVNISTRGGPTHVLFVIGAP